MAEPALAAAQTRVTLSLLLPAAVIASALAPQPLNRLPADLNPLIQALQSKGFSVRIALPPVKGSYGLFQAKSKTLWISPLTIPLGIVRQTVLHEAVHAVQSCPSGTLTPLGWSAQLNPVVEREISAILLRNYHHSSRVLEREAFMLQGQRDAVPKLVKALQQRCR